MEHSTWKGEINQVVSHDGRLNLSIFNQPLCNINFKCFVYSNEFHFYKGEKFG